MLTNLDKMRIATNVLGEFLSLIQEDTPEIIDREEVAEEMVAGFIDILCKEYDSEIEMLNEMSEVGKAIISNYFLPLGAMNDNLTIN